MSPQLTFLQAFQAYWCLRIFLGGLLLFALAIICYVIAIQTDYTLLFAMTYGLVILAIPITIIGYLGLMRERITQFFRQ